MKCWYKLMEHAEHVYKVCKDCKLTWNVSVKHKGKVYQCPICEEKAKKAKKKYGNTPRVLIKNKNRVNA